MSEPPVAAMLSGAFGKSEAASMKRARCWAFFACFTSDEHARWLITSASVASFKATDAIANSFGATPSRFMPVSM
jgi:hypothetical protein